MASSSSETKGSDVKDPLFGARVEEDLAAVQGRRGAFLLTLIRSLPTLLWSMRCIAVICERRGGKVWFKIVSC